MTEAILTLAGGLSVGAIFGFAKLAVARILAAVGMFIVYQFLWKNNVIIKGAVLCVTLML